MSKKVAIHKSTIPDSKMFVVKELEDAHFDPVWHAHSEYQLFVVLKGSGTRFIGDSIRSFRENELVFTGADLPHLWRSDEAYFRKDSQMAVKGIVIYLRENFLGEQMMHKEEMLMLKKLFKKSAKGLEFYGDGRDKVITMMGELLKMRGLQSLIHLLKIMELLAYSKDYHYISEAEHTGPFKKNETDRMNKVYEYALANFRGKISVPELCDAVHDTVILQPLFYGSK